MENASTQFPNLNPDDMQPTDIGAKKEDEVSTNSTSAEANAVDDKPFTSSPSIHLYNQSDLKNETGKQIELSDSSRKDEYKVLEVDFPEEEIGEDCDIVKQQEPSQFKIEEEFNASNVLENEIIAVEESVVCLDGDGDEDAPGDKDETGISVIAADETSVLDCDEIRNTIPIPAQNENDSKEAGAPPQTKSNAKDDKCGDNKDRKEKFQLSTDLEKQAEEALIEKQHCHSKVNTNKNYKEKVIENGKDHDDIDNSCGNVGTVNDELSADEEDAENETDTQAKSSLDVSTKKNDVQRETITNDDATRTEETPGGSGTAAEHELSESKSTTGVNNAKKPETTERSRIRVRKSLEKVNTLDSKEVTTPKNDSSSEGQTENKSDTDVKHEQVPQIRVRKSLSMVKTKTTPSKTTIMNMMPQNISQESQNERLNNEAKEAVLLSSSDEDSNSEREDGRLEKAKSPSNLDQENEEARLMVLKSTSSEPEMLLKQQDSSEVSSRKRLKTKRELDKIRRKSGHSDQVEMASDSDAEDKGRTKRKRSPSPDMFASSDSSSNEVHSPVQRKKQKVERASSSIAIVPEDLNLDVNNLANCRVDIQNIHADVKERLKIYKKVHFILKYFLTNILNLITYQLSPCLFYHSH